MRVRVAAAVVSLLVAGCGVEEPQVAPPAVEEALPELVGAPHEAAVAGTTLRVEVIRAWRIVQPQGGWGGVPRCAYLCASVRVVPVDGGAVGDVAVEQMWVLRDDGTAAFQRLVTRPGRPLEVVGSRGPVTEVGRQISIVVELVGAGGESVLLRSAAVTVERAG